MNTRNAACSCGRLSIIVEETPVRISMCHCLACQRRTGSVFGAQAWYPKEKVTVSGPSSEYCRTADSGKRITYHFCSECGSTVYYQADAFPDRTAVPIGAFADPSFPVPMVSIYESSKHAWVTVPTDLEHHDD